MGLDEFFSRLNPANIRIPSTPSAKSVTSRLPSRPSTTPGPLPRPTPGPAPSPTLPPIADPNTRIPLYNTEEELRLRQQSEFLEEQRRQPRAAGPPPLPQLFSRETTPYDTQISGRELSNLIKIYSDSMKYSGGDDCFDYKLQIFYDFCFKANLGSAAYALAFSTMLKGQAHEYYFDHISGQTVDFKVMETRVRAHFETPERHQRLLTLWHGQSFAVTIAKFPEKPYSNASST
jgi:hypothetical protein